MQRLHQGCRRFAGLPGLQTHEHLKPPRRPAVQTRLAAANEWLGAERNHDLERPTRGNPEESRRRHAHDRERHAPECQRAADHVTCTAEIRLPERVTDHYDRPAAAAAADIVGRLEQAAERRCDAEHVESSGAGPYAVDEVALSSGAQIELCVEPGPRKRAIELRAVSLDPLPDRVGPRPLLRRRPGDELRQPLGIFDWQRPEEEAVDDGEDRRVGADAQRERGDDHGGERALPAKSRNAWRTSRPRSSRSAP